MDIRVIVEFDSVVQAYAAHCPELPGCTSAGMTEEEALENIREAVDLFSLRTINLSKIEECIRFPYRCRNDLPLSK